jgi:hypothetical protein
MKNETSSANYLKKELVAILFMLNSIYAFAQSQSSLWTIPPTEIEFCAQPTYSTVKFDALNPLAYSGEASSHLSSSMHDVNGELLFFVADDGLGVASIFDKNSNLIDVLKPDISFFRNWSDEINIVPVPGSCTKYYLIMGVWQYQAGGGGVRTFYPVYSILELLLLSGRKS